MKLSTFGNEEKEEQDENNNHDDDDEADGNLDNDVADDDNYEDDADGDHLQGREEAEPVPEPRHGGHNLPPGSLGQ